MKETELMILTIVSFSNVEAKLGSNKTARLIDRVSIAETTVLSVIEEINIPIAITAPPKSNIPSKE